MNRTLTSILLLLGTILATTPSMLPAASSARFHAGDISSPEFFPILPWDPLHGSKPPFIHRKETGLESIAECNFNMAGFVFKSDLARCEKLGLGAIMLPLDDSSLPLRFHKDWKKLTGDEIDRRIEHIVKSCGKSSAIQGYFIMDEPGITDFPALGKAVAAVKKHAPGKLAYINLFPNYATIGAPDMSQLGTSNYTEYLERFVSEVKPQLISYDNYQVQMSQDLTNAARAASYYKNLLEVRRVALKHGLPYLNIVSANQIRPHTPIPSPANLNFQAYTTLAAGYRGVTWYTYYSKGYGYAAINTNEQKTLTWAYLQEVNRQAATLAPVMSRLQSTGVYFSAPAPVQGLPLLPGSLVSSVSCAMPLMIGEFKHSEGGRYVMVVNLSLEKSAKFTLTTETPAEKIRIISAMNGETMDLDDKNGVWLTAGQGLLLSLDGEPSSRKPDKRASGKTPRR